ncbi:MAG TPA: MOSC N-terminal beta barrel domain-containing protein, partial [Gemmatimonadales bacterium]|nr:MOSC N-terminal beta barrel domain-containing protein [Gemmatimonadales bacterium]
ALPAGTCRSQIDLMTLQLTGLTVYPIKSAGGIPVSDWPVDEFGLRYDRRWMLVDDSGEFLSQRSHPRLALARPSIRDGSLRIDAPGMPSLELPLEPTASVTTDVTVWNDTCPAAWLGERPASWFSDFLGSSCSLVYMTGETLRPADPAYAPDGTRVSFADAFPFLIISEESLADLNRRLARPLPMNRFRPNLVVAGGAPYQEDLWERIEINGIGIRVVKPCARCVVTTTDQVTAEQGREPLRTLATYRQISGKVMFGQNAVHERTGRLRVGDAVLVTASVRPAV